MRTYKEFLGTCVKSKKQYIYRLYQLGKNFKLIASSHLIFQHTKEDFPQKFIFTTSKKLLRILKLGKRMQNKVKNKVRNNFRFKSLALTKPITSYSKL